MSRLAPIVLVVAAILLVLIVPAVIPTWVSILVVVAGLFVAGVGIERGSMKH